ncbi:MAG: hypothetical protein WAT23_20330, partial [Chromatiaceae bacterium]
ARGAQALQDRLMPFLHLLPERYRGPNARVSVTPGLDSQGTDAPLARASEPAGGRLASRSQESQS